MKPLKSTFLLSIIALIFSCKSTNRIAVPSSPSFYGTIFLDPDIITTSDPTTFKSLVYTDQAERRMYDRRVNNWVTVNAFLFNAEYTDGLSSEIQVNIEFNDKETAEIEALKYAKEIGKIPYVLREDVKTVSIHKGTQPFGGGNNNLLIHTGQASFYEEKGILEETFVHEASHTSLDAKHARATGWASAQTEDPTFISTYAKNNPIREDVAESFLLYLAVRYRPDRINKSLKDTIETFIPNRIKYFDKQNLNMSPIK